MKNRTERMFGMAVLLLCSAGVARGAPQGGNMLPASPMPLVTVSPAIPANLPNIDEAKVKKFSPLAFIVTNNSNQAITGIYIRWSWPDPSDPNHMIVHDLATDSYKVPRFAPVVPAHERILVAPGALVQEPFADTSPHTGGNTLDMLDGKGGFAPWPAGSFILKVEIKSIIFEDGSVYGQTDVNYDSEIQNRAIMGLALAKQIRNAMANGEDLNKTLSPMVATGVAPNDSAARWRNMYARSLMNKSPDSPSWKARMNTLEHPQALPAFVRKGE